MAGLPQAGVKQLVPLFDHLENKQNLEMLLWCINQSDAVRVDQDLKDKIDALNWPPNLVPGPTQTTKSCRGAAVEQHMHRISGGKWDKQHLPHRCCQGGQPRRAATSRRPSCGKSRPRTT